MEYEQQRSFTRSWEKIEPVMKDVAELLRAMDVDNLYWIGPRSLGSSTLTDPYLFVLPPGVDDDIALILSQKIAEMALDATGVDCIVQAWNSLPETKQVLWGAEGVPLFEQVSPLDYMNAQLAEQRKARLLR